MAALGLTKKNTAPLVQVEKGEANREGFSEGERAGPALENPPPHSERQPAKNQAEAEK